MSDEKISALTDGVAPTSGDLFAIARSGANYSISWDEITTAIPSGIDSSGVYAVILDARGQATSNMTGAGLYFLNGNNTDDGSGTGSGAPYGMGVPTSQFFQTVVLKSADYALGGKTTMLNLRAMIFTGASTLGKTVTFGVYPVIMSSGNITGGTVISGSTFTMNPSSANTIIDSDSGDFALPSDGVYTIGFTVSGVPSNTVLVHGQLMVHNV